MVNTASTLKKLAIKKGVDLNRIKVIYALERMIARFESISKLSKNLIYKGGYVLYKTT